ncbi:MAG: LapA family protein [Stigonema ocellatum SAG 48.90 = DSM 106950]|nr:LapA family protein [Stigonema ocellatum SAG 48.90 = DSM 106950]
MKTLANLLISIVVAFWVVAIAILSVQNADSVTLKFLTFQSIQIPVGLVLAFSAGVGIIGMALLQPLWGLAGSGQSNLKSEDDTEFFVDDENF